MISSSALQSSSMTRGEAVRTDEIEQSPARDKLACKCLALRARTWRIKKVGHTSHEVPVRIVIVCIWVSDYCQHVMKRYISASHCRMFLPACIFWWQYRSMGLFLGLNQLAASMSLLQCVSDIRTSDAALFFSVLQDLGICAACKTPTVNQRVQ